MEEIKVENNPLGIRVFVNGKPDVNDMPEEQHGLFISSLALRISEYYGKSENEVKRHTNKYGKNVNEVCAENKVNKIKNSSKGEIK